VRQHDREEDARRALVPDGVQLVDETRTGGRMDVIVRSRGGQRLRHAQSRSRVTPYACESTAPDPENEKYQSTRRLASERASRGRSVPQLEVSCARKRGKKLLREIVACTQLPLSAVIWARNWDRIPSKNGSLVLIKFPITGSSRLVERS